MRHNPGGVFNGNTPQPYRPQPKPYRPGYDPYGYPTPGTGAPKREKPKPRKKEKMSQALWCDAGDHAFSSNDPNRHRFSETKMEKDPQYGGQMEVTTTVDVCGPCWNTNNPFRKDTKKASLPQDESYLKGYRDGIVKGETLS